MNYHAHIFFSSSEAAEAEALRQRLGTLVPTGLTVGAFLPRAAGPLPEPMVQLDYPQSIADHVERLLRPHCDGRSVLIHPVLDDELAAHTTHATWLGPVLALRLDRL